MSRFVLFLLLSACSGDPREAPEMEPAITGEVVVRGSNASGPLSGPIQVAFHFEGPGVYGSRDVISQQAWTDGRGNHDQWTVSPSEGVTDPSVFWEDQVRPGKRKHVVLTPAKPVDIDIRLDESVRFPRPGTYAVQLTTTRAKDRVRAEPVLVKVGPAGNRDARAKELLEVIETRNGLEQSQAFVDLALVGAPSAIDIAIDKLGHPAQGKLWSLVLHAHPASDMVRGKLQAAIEDPQAPVPAAMLETLTALCYNARFDWPIPLPDNSAADQARHRLERQVREKATSECRDEAAATIAAKATEKEGEARGVTMATLLRHRALHPGEPEWGPTIAREAARSLALVDEAVLRAWLTKELYRRNLDTEAMVEPLEKLAVEPTLRGDLALEGLHRASPAKALTIAAGRFAHPTPMVLDGISWILEASKPSDADIDSLHQALDLSDVTRVRLAAHFAQQRHGERWAELYDALPPGAKDPLVGAVVAGLVNARHAKAKAGLNLYGPSHPQLLVEAAKSVRDPRSLVERAFEGLIIDDFEVTRGAALVLADHMVASDKGRLLRMCKRVDGRGEFGCAFAFATARAWTPTFEENDALGSTMRMSSATAFLENQDFASKSTIVLKASEVRHQPAIEFNGQMYVGEAEILAKMRQFHPPNGVKFGFSGIDAGENLPRFEGWAKSVGLSIFQDE